MKKRNTNWVFCFLLHQRVCSYLQLILLREAEALFPIIISHPQRLKSFGIAESMCSTSLPPTWRYETLSPINQIFYMLKINLTTPSLSSIYPQPNKTHQPRINILKWVMSLMTNLPKIPFS